MPHSLPHENLEALPQSLAGQAREFQQAADYAGDGGGAGESGAAAIPRLVAWAKKRGKLIPEARFEPLSLPISNSTSEHEVWFDETRERAVKRTWAGVYGQIPFAQNGKVGRRNATLPEYLHRMALQIAVFASDLVPIDLQMALFDPDEMRCAGGMDETWHTSIHQYTKGPRVVPV